MAAHGRLMTCVPNGRGCAETIGAFRLPVAGSVASGAFGQIQPLGFRGFKRGLPFAKSFGRLAEFHRLAGENLGVGEKRVQLADLGFQAGDQVGQVVKPLPFGEGQAGRFC